MNEPLAFQLLLHDDMIQSLSHLEAPIQEAVYRNLYEMRREAELLPETVPDDYGKQIFCSKQGCSIQERIQAVDLAIREFKAKLTRKRPRQEGKED